VCDSWDVSLGPISLQVMCTLISWTFVYIIKDSLNICVQPLLFIFDLF
jgi:hypothetical protein